MERNILLISVFLLHIIKMFYIYIMNVCITNLKCRLFM